MNRIKRIILGLLAALLLLTTAPISADNHIYNPEVQTSNISSSLQTDRLASSNKKSVTVYITKTGEKYHRSNCRYLKKSKISISLSDAKKNGYTACKVCKPPK